jgi:hypothetical protein
MVEIFNRSRDEIDYRPTLFLRMVTDHGGVEAAHRLLASRAVPEGLLTLAQAGRLDLSVEAHILRDEYAELFAPEERDVARRRLAEFGHRQELATGSRRRPARRSSP